MLYIEDFLELIEPFPQEIRERLTEMREIDLQIQNETDKLDDRIQVFFHQCKRQRTDWKNENYEEIRREYLKLLESAEDKVQIANQLYDLIEKYLKKLDQELQKFKLELEADHAGITSKLEQVISSTNNANMNETSPVTNPNMCSGGLSLEDSDFTLNSSSTNELMILMMQQQQQQQQNQDHHTPSSHTHTGSHKRKHSNLTNRTADDEDSSSSWNSKFESLSSQQKSNATFHFSNSNKKISSLIGSTSQSTTKKNTGNICFGQRPSSSNADSLMKLVKNSSVSSQVAANRRSTSSKPSKPAKQRKKNKINDLDYEDEDYDLKNDLDDNDFTDELNEEASETATSENDNVFNNGVGGIHRQLNDDFYESDNSSGDEQNNLDQNEDTTSDEILDNKIKKEGHLKRTSARPFKEDWNSGEDTNERYCICKDISYGDMIMCDNSRCETQWFHFVCVGLSSAPKGKWFCPTCVESKKKRKEKLTINNLNPGHSSSSSFLSMNKPTTESQLHQHQSSNPFLSSSSSFSINFNEKNF